MTDTEQISDQVQNTKPAQKHHPFSPSRLQQLSECPGSYKMQMGLHDTQSADAAEGSMLHECLASGHFDGLTAEQSEMCAACLKFLNDVSGGPESGAKIYHEKHVQVHSGTPRHVVTLDSETGLEIEDDTDVLTEGTADVIIEHANGALSVIDWKFGRNPVAEVNRNLQLAAYSVGSMQAFTRNSCKCYVFQPRIYHTSSYEFTKPDAIITNIQNIIERALSPVIVLNAEGSACKYCLAKATCPAFLARFKHISSLPRITDNPNDLARLYDESKRVEAFCREIKDALSAYISEHGECAGYIFKEKAGPRIISDAMGCYDVVRELVSPAEFNSVCTVSASKLIDLVVDKMRVAAGASGQKMTKVSAKKLVEETLGGLISEGKKTKSIVMG